MKNLTKQLVTLLLVAMLCGGPELVSATTMPQSAGQEQQQTSEQQPQEPAAQPPAANSEPQQPPTQPTENPNPAAAPQGNTQTLPDAPSATQSSSKDTQQQDVAPQQTETPAGTAAAKAGNVKGGPASKPAGAAIAPAKQRQTRSLLIKIGLLAGAGVALGMVFALSKGSPSRPPGSQ